MSNENDGLVLLAKKYANELERQVNDLIEESRKRPHPSPMISVLRPLIEEISRVRVAAEWVRIPGYTRWGADAVPGDGPILNCEMFDGLVYATRKSGKEVFEWKATASGWEKVSNVELTRLAFGQSGGAKRNES